MQRIGRVGALLVGIIGVLVVVGWYTGVPVLKTVLPGQTSMKPNTALALGVIAVGVLMMDRGRWAVPLGALATVVGSATLLGYGLGLPLGDDVLLPGIDLGDDAPRMAPATALALLLLGLSVIAGRRGKVKVMRSLAFVDPAPGSLRCAGTSLRRFRQRRAVRTPDGPCPAGWPVRSGQKTQAGWTRGSGCLSWS